MTTARQLGFAVPQEQDLYRLEVRTGIDAGVWLVERQLVRTPDGILYNEGLTRIQAYDALQTYPALREAGFELVPVTVLLYGIQHYKDFYEMLRGTSQLTGSGTAEQEDGRLFLGTPNVIAGEELQYRGLRNDRPSAWIEPKNGTVARLNKITLWGVGEDSEVESEKPAHLTYMYNGRGNRFVVLGVRFYGDVIVNANWDPLVEGLGGGARLAKKIDKLTYP